MVSSIVLRSQSDAKLAALAAQGSEAAFETIVQRYRRLLLSYCRRLALSESRSEDVVQQALVNAWSSLRSGTQVRDVKPWLYRITHNAAIGALRRPDPEVAELDDCLCAADPPEADLERRTLLREALSAVAALPDMQREAIVRTAIDGFSYEEVAAALGLSNTAVRGLVYRARAALRAGVAAVAPGPVVSWAGAMRRGVLPERVAEVVAGGGSAGGAALLLKGAGVLATSAVLVGGAVSGVERHVIAAGGARRSRVHASARVAPVHASARVAPVRAAARPAARLVSPVSRSAPVVAAVTVTRVPAVARPVAAVSATAHPALHVTWVVPRATRPSRTGQRATTGSVSKQSLPARNGQSLPARHQSSPARNPSPPATGIVSSAPVTEREAPDAPPPTGSGGAPGR